eukprot:CAMPEP_0203929920 /NCGR_PEP_ID=MMETSP0359-20131031/68760_1 /ASSEMBLY_ACC=CAM_ASM_000338 /TAXON_ID=268821 /ORGANISM="Scrippsiella Hangoei, Strain SHTV-5" /LENGTH=40 /DNA_ID= /DNA_START= /DNA_END= /DNA_ORIENTATION=
MPSWPSPCRPAVEAGAGAAFLSTDPVEGGSSEGADTHETR